MHNKKHVVVTGASGGIGIAILKSLIDDGFIVIATDQDEEKIDKVRSEFGNENILYYALNLNDKQGIIQFYNWVENLNVEIYALVNNAGAYYGKPYEDFSEAELLNSLNVNLMAPMLLSEYFGNYFLKQKRDSRIINISTVAAEVGSQESPYAAFKAGVFGLTKANAMNFAPYVRVNAISPAAVRETDIWNLIPEYRKKAYVGQELLNEPIVPKSIADVVNFFLAKGSSCITGKILGIDNGCYPR